MRQDSLKYQCSDRSVNLYLRTEFHEDKGEFCDVRDDQRKEEHDTD